MDSSTLELISRKLIKPSNKPPPIYKLSILDQVIHGDIYNRIVFFYPNENKSYISTTLLENSLSKVLTSYYPLAGRLVDNLNIDCYEVGATLIEARANCKLSQISIHPNVKDQDVILPRGMSCRPKPDESLLVAQLTYFDCGGTTLSLCMSHKLSDGLSLVNFARDWALITEQGGDHKSALTTPQLNAASILPPIEDTSFKNEIGLFPEGTNCVTKRYIFSSTKLSQLKIKASVETGIKNPTRVEVVTALLNKCAIAATSLVHANSCKPPVIMQAVNIRSLIDPPFSPNSVGNFVSSFSIPFPDGKDLSFARLFRKSREAKLQFRERYNGIPADKLRQEFINTVEFAKMIVDESRTNFDAYVCSSMCRFPLYDIDFGWGNPETVSFAATQNKNFFLLIDERNGDGIEAFVTLEEEVMTAFERDPELLQFVSFGPTIARL
nr:BAHD acyltransferase [Echium plantagineum]